MLNKQMCLGFKHNLCQSLMNITTLLEELDCPQPLDFSTQKSKRSKRRAQARRASARGGGGGGGGEGAFRFALASSSLPFSPRAH